MITVGSNLIDNPRTLFLLRKLYATDGYPLDNPDFLAKSSNMDFNLYKPFYGRIDLFSDTVTNCSITNDKDLINTSILSETNVKSFGFDQSKKAFNFTVDAFTEMRTTYNQLCASQSGLSRNGVISSLNIYKAWESPIQNYIDHFGRIYKIFKEKFLNNYNQNNINNLNDFLTVFVSFIDAYLDRWPVTYGNYTISKYCPPQVSGIVIDLIKIDFGEDYEKTALFVNDINFPTYVEQAERYGFYIDRNAPWRLIQNLSSEYTFKYIKKYGVNTLEELFNKKYIKNYKIDIKLLMEQLYKIYNSFVTDFPEQNTSGSKCNPNVRIVKKRNKITFLDFKQLVSLKRILKLYCFLRAREVNLRFDANYFNNALKECQNIYDIYGLEKACNYINNYFNFYKSEIINRNFLTEKNSSVIDEPVEQQERLEKIKIIF